MTTQTTLSRTKAPFRADHVGSFLRPESIKKARKELAEGTITNEDLREIENVEITRIVDKQIELGYKGITDGEFRRSYWHFDFLENLLGFEGYLAAQGKQFHNVVTSAHSVRNIGKIAFNPEHPFFADYAFLAEVVGDKAVAKVSIPSPNQLIRLGFRNEEIYPTLEEYAADLQRAYRDTILHFYSLGNRYIQIDDTFWGDLCSDKALEIFGSQETYDELKRVATENVKNIQVGLPEDLVVTTHICRGNFRSSYSQEGAYEPVAKELFGETGFDGFFLEYDTDRAGGFEPLRYYKGDGQIILGLVTSKTPELEDIGEVKARIAEAAKFVPLEQLCLSPQCGFASTEEGNNLTEEQQWAKLALVKQIADEVWGD